ncbi:hypothetical protein F5Y12DRAFT_717376 [Xylaria sp. FL1777]|nr:hypothetical protein F5Y12DRAFT_717376 [Xylaria sp. FL1777]
MLFAISCSRPFPNDSLAGVFNNEERRREREIKAGRDKTESLEERVKSLMREQVCICEPSKGIQQKSWNKRELICAELGLGKRPNNPDSVSLIKRTETGGIMPVMSNPLNDGGGALESFQRKIRRTDDPSTKDRDVALRKRIEESAQEAEGSEAKIEKGHEKFKEAAKILLSNEEMLDYVVKYKRLVPDLRSHLAVLETHIRSLVTYLDEFLSIIPKGVERTDKFLVGMRYNDETRVFAQTNRSQEDIRELVEDATMSEETCNQMYQKAFANELTRLIECLNKSHQGVIVSPEVINIAK